MITEVSEGVATGKSLTYSQEPAPILLTVRELHHGRIERDVTKLALTLDRSQFEPHVASYQTEGMRFEELRHGGIPIFHLPVSSLKSPTAFSAAMRLRGVHPGTLDSTLHAYDFSYR
jgi:hypothetical protein